MWANKPARKGERGNENEPSTSHVQETLPVIAIERLFLKTSDKVGENWLQADCSKVVVIYDIFILYAEELQPVLDSFVDVEEIVTYELKDSSKHPCAILTGCRKMQHIRVWSKGLVIVNNVPVQCIRQGSSGLSLICSKIALYAGPPLVRIPVYNVANA